MAKRFTDTEKWKRPWFARLAPLEKLAWIYVLDECDSVGVWHAHFKRMSSDLDTSISESDFERIFDGKIIKIDADKYLIPSFLEFQYGAMKPSNRTHVGIMMRIAKAASSLPLDGRSRVLLEKFNEIAKTGTPCPPSPHPPKAPSRKGPSTLKEEEEVMEEEEEKEEVDQLPPEDAARNARLIAEIAATLSGKPTLVPGVSA